MRRNELASDILKASMTQQLPSMSSSYRFVSLSAVTAGVKDVREVVDEARRISKNGVGSVRTVSFVDEVHRFNKSQLDSFLPVIEDGSIVFIGATTKNPSFHFITPLLSSCRVLTLNFLEHVHIAAILRRASDDRDNGLVCSLGFMPKEIVVSDEVVEYLSQHCDGDACVAILWILSSCGSCHLVDPVILQMNNDGRTDEQLFNQNNE